VQEPVALATALQQALARQLREAVGPVGRNFHGYKAGWPVSLAAAGASTQMAQRLRGLGPRATRPESAMALALSSFMPWMERPETLHLVGITQFRELNFDVRCPTGIRGTPPHIEVVASGPAGVVGVTAQMFDYLALRRSKLSAAYATLDVPPRLEPWAALMRSSPDTRADFAHVNVPALGKLAVGLGRIFEHRPVRLLYLFLEPTAAAAFPPFADHRAELARVAEQTRDSAVTLVAVSFHELWEEWCAAETPARLREIAAQLSRVYAVAMPR
jgi:hypothetical protein